MKKLIKGIIVVNFLLFCSLVYGQNNNPLNGYEYKTFDERIDLLDSILKADYPDNLTQVMFCAEDIESISGIHMSGDFITHSGDLASMGILKEELYLKYIKSLRDFSEKLKGIRVKEEEKEK
ncbi:MAG: hypothetical protein COB15_11745 [Flavobacteriales bacterium]|nr:MAG: hypothetical protein COB15_11745 [Flavobacteriales bacterium]